MVCVFTLLFRMQKTKSELGLRSKLFHRKAVRALKMFSLFKVLEQFCAFLSKRYAILDRTFAEGDVWWRCLANNVYQTL